MKTILLPPAGVGVLCLWLFLLSGCTSFIIVQPGMVADPEARISLVEGGRVEGIWEARDLRLDYALTTTADQVTLSGRLVIDRAVTNSFPVADQFFLRMNFLDAEGRVIASTDITPLYSYRNRFAESTDLQVRRPRPAGSQAIAFNYFGVFRGQVNDEAGGDSWEIFHSPFQ